MTDTQKVLIELLSLSIRGNSDVFINESQIFNEELYNEAYAHQVQTLIFPYINKIAAEGSKKDKFFGIWKQDVLKNISQQIQQCQKAYELLDLFSEQSIPVISLKGLAIRTLYPHPDLRIMGDVDLLVKTSDINKIKLIMKQNGFIKKHMDHKHLVFINESGMIVEVHTSLSEDRSSDSIRVLSETIWKTAVPFLVNGKVYSLMPAPFHHILFLILHMAGHITKEGFGLRQLCDLTLLVEKSNMVIDWDEFFKACESIGVNNFAKALLMVLQIIFSLDGGPEYKFTDVKDKEFLNKLIDDILNSGVFGGKTAERAIGNKYLRYAGISNEGEFGKQKSPRSIKNILLMLFPSPSKMGIDYNYARKHAILTPVAWCHRLLRTMIRRDFTLQEKLSLMFSGSVKNIYSNRSELLKWLGLNHKA